MATGRVSVIGLGYIGLPTAALLAQTGYEVSGTDISTHVVETVNRGEVHIIEPGLETVVRDQVSAGNLRAYSTVQHSDIYFICVPTPLAQGEERPKPDLSFVMQAAEQIAAVLEPGNIVILESTSPVGATEAVYDLLYSLGAPASQCDFAYCPERVLPGQLMRELVENDRIVGGLTKEATKRIAGFYRTFVTGTVHSTDARTAEMCKLTENSFRDVNIAFANELSILADKQGVDIWRLIQLANRHPRVNILQPGTGVGGHCIAVDPWFLVDANPENAELIAQARHTNDSKPAWVVSKIQEAVQVSAKHGDEQFVIGCLGLAFKPNIDDVRGSPALQVVQQLIDSGHSVLAVDPYVKFDGNMPMCDLKSVFQKVDLLVILVAHDDFRGVYEEAAVADIEVLDFSGMRRKA